MNIPHGAHLLTTVMPVITRPVYIKNIKNSPYPNRECEIEVVSVRSKSELSFVVVIAMLHSVSYYTELCYNVNLVYYPPSNTYF